MPNDLDSAAKHARTKTVLDLLRGQNVTLDMRVRAAVRETIDKLETKDLHTDNAVPIILENLHSMEIGKGSVNRQKVIDDLHVESQTTQKLIKQVLHFGLPRNRNGD